MDEFFLDPATADPAVIICGILSHLFCDLPEFQSEKCRCILRASHRIQFQSDISYLMITEIQADLVAFCHVVGGKILNVIFFADIRINILCFYDIYDRNRTDYCLDQFRCTCFCFFYKIIVGHADHVQVNAYFCHYAFALLSSSSFTICG